MPEHLRALVAILASAVLVFALAERALCPDVVAREDFRRRRNAWFTFTVIAFLSHNFWLFVLLTSLSVMYFRSKEANPLALYFTVLFAVPVFSMQVPGFGLVNYFVSLNYYKVLNLTLLLPLAIALAHRVPTPAKVRIADLLLLSYLGYTLAMRMPMLNVTSGMRAVFDMAVDVWLPYYVASRALNGAKPWREAIAGFVVGVVVLGVMSPIESAKGWLLYDGLRSALGVPPSELGVYILRGEEGALRANGPVGNSIVLGYVMMIALVLYLHVKPMVRGPVYGWLGAAGLVAGLVAALSRGPWVGAAAGLLVALSLGPNGVQRFVYAAAAAAVAVIAALVMPGGEKLIGFLPFVGSVDEGSVTYRQQLFDISMGVFWNSPIFGALDYMTNPVMEELRQGQGIIDMVNTYLAVALPYGAVGLLLFCAPFAWALWVCGSAMVANRGTSNEAHRLGRVLVGAMVAMLVTIATVSSISVVAPVYWLLTGLCIGYGRSQLAAATHAARSPLHARAVPRHAAPR
jgi:O-antigen ligase